jgi:hypothetical protein
MDLSVAYTEPMRRMIKFHDRFNRNMKIAFGSMTKVASAAARSKRSATTSLPTGSEPWGATTKWKNIAQHTEQAAEFLAEVGIARTASAFEDFLTGAQAEFSRGSLVPSARAVSGSTFLKLANDLGISLANISDLVAMEEFFGVARNCVVHRSNRASSSLQTLRYSASVITALGRWGKRAGKWTIELPDVKAGEPVAWLPRHAILSSDVYYRCANLLDRSLVTALGPNGMTCMAAHWTFFATDPVPCAAKLDPETMIRSQLMGRYGVRSLHLREGVDALRAEGRWEAVRGAYSSMYPDGSPVARLQKRRRSS